MDSRKTVSRRALLAQAAPVVAGSLVAISSTRLALAQERSPNTAGSSSNEKIWSGEYWAKKGDLALYIFRKRLGAPQPGEAPRPILFLAHGSSVSARPTYDLTVPGHSDYSLMDKFSEYGFDVWTMDFEGYGKSAIGPGNSDIASGVEDLRPLPK
jgi:hypothetical protein